MLPIYLFFLQRSRLYVLGFVCMCTSNFILFFSFFFLLFFLGDLATVVMVWDMINQDESVYPQWNAKFKNLWIHGWDGKFRVVAVWVLVLFSTTLVFIGIQASGSEDGLNWAAWNTTGGTTEGIRTFLVSIILITDLMIVAQDWEFPTFDDDMTTEIKIAGTFVTEINIQWFDVLADKLKACLAGTKIESWWQALLESGFFHVIITGKWMNYGPLFVIIGFDLNMMKNQLIYAPQNFGQYINPETNEIWAITDTDYLDLAYTNGVLVQPELITWEARVGAENPSASALTDFNTTSRYVGTSGFLLFLAALPGLSALAFFIYLVWKGNKPPEQRKTHQVAVIERRATQATPSQNTRRV